MERTIQTYTTAILYKAHKSFQPETPGGKSTRNKTETDNTGTLPNQLLGVEF